MFGHVRGAFTDARADRKGRFELAHGGTIFLDEIGDLDPASQVKMLRVLQDRTFEVLGSSQRREVDVRVVSATNRALPDMVARGEFREDLLYRINLITIHLPPLRERPDDIPLLASRFLQAAAAAYRREAVMLTPAAARWLQAQPWPGNVRQLQQAVERAVLVDSRDRLDVESFTDLAEAPGREAVRFAARRRRDDDRRDRAGDDPQVAAPSRRQHQPGRRVARPEPAGPLSPLREVRDHRVSFRARLVTYFVVVHLALAGLGGWLVWTQPYALVGVEIALAVSLAIGIGLVRRAIGYRALAADARRLVHDEAFTSRFLPVGEPDVDELIALYNRMVDRLRDERVRLAEQHQFLAQVLAVSPSGIVVLGFDGEVTSLNPAAARLLGVPATSTGRRARRARLAARRGGGGLGPGESQVIGLDGSARVRVAARRVRRSRLPARVLRAGGNDRRAAPGRAGRLREADSRDVARGEQHRRLVDVAAPVVADLRPRAVAGEPDRLRDRARRRDCAHRAAEHVHEGLRRRVPPAGAGEAAVRAGGDPRARGGAHQRQAGRRRDRLAVGAGCAGDPRQRRSGAARTGHPQRRQERRRGGRRRPAGRSRSARRRRRIRRCSSSRTAAPG